MRETEKDTLEKHRTSHVAGCSVEKPCLRVNRRDEQEVPWNQRWVTEAAGDEVRKLPSWTELALRIKHNDVLSAVGCAGGEGKVCTKIHYNLSLCATVKANIFSDFKNI